MFTESALIIEHLLASEQKEGMFVAGQFSGSCLEALVMGTQRRAKEPVGSKSLRACCTTD